MARNIELSFTKGKPIARINGGIHHGKTIHIFDPDTDTVKPQKCCKKCSDKCMKAKRKCCKKCKAMEGGCGSCGIKTEDDMELISDPYDYIDDQFVRSQKKRMSVLELEKIKRALQQKKSDNLDPELGDIYNNTKNLLDKKIKTELVIHDGEVIPLPNDDIVQGSRAYIAGATGCGKSTWISKFATEYKRMFPGKDVIVFSNENEDQVIDKLKPMRIKLDESIISKPIEKEELKHSLVIFDDIDAMTNKKIEDAISVLRDNLLKEGRKHDIYVVCSAHQLTNYQRSRNTLNDCDSIIFFPKSNPYGIKYYLKSYGGMTKQQMERVMQLPSRWVCFKKNYPGVIIYSSGVYLLTN